MGTSEEELAKIHIYVMENMGYFCDPHPEGLGWPRPGGVPKYYLDHPDEWELDLNRIEDLREAAPLRNAAAGREQYSPDCTERRKQGGGD